ncbi:ATP-binding cassette domain-containing protein, partial [Desulfoprunum benzoelyticum]|uniref:ABC transporter ATP-binding protein n=1 Tax=Desulfoprunum benzoelyticum TaxID=1506996 RepID=UPI001962DE84
MSTILETKNLTMRFGGLVAVSDFTASIPQGSITGLIGPNGAGKTTCFNMVTGFYRPTEGQVFFEGKELTGMSPHQVCRAGIARTFQNIRLFGNETALENVMIGSFVRQRTGWI